jgi:hypothetical protein
MRLSVPGGRPPPLLGSFEVNMRACLVTFGTRTRTDATSTVVFALLVFYRSPDAKARSACAARREFADTQAKPEVGPFATARC